MTKSFFKASFLNSSQVKFLKKKFIEKPSLEKIIDIDEFLEHEEGKFIFNDKLINLTEKNLELKDYVFLNLVKILKSNKNKSSGGWHLDYGSKEHQKSILVKRKNFIYKIGLYLQENKKNFGGGVDVLKPSFLNNLQSQNLLIRFLKRIYNSFFLRFYDNTIKTNEGDILGFNSFCYHRTTPAKFVKEENNYNIYFVLTNFETIKDSLLYYDELYKTKKNENLMENIKTKNLDNLKIPILSHEYSRIVENVLGE